MRAQFMLLVLLICYVSIAVEFVMGSKEAVFDMDAAIRDLANQYSSGNRNGTHPLGKKLKSGQRQSDYILKCFDTSKVDKCLTKQQPLPAGARQARHEEAQCGYPWFLLDRNCICKSRFQQDNLNQCLSDNQRPSHCAFDPDVIRDQIMTRAQAMCYGTAVQTSNAHSWQYSSVFAIVSILIIKLLVI